MSDVGPGIFVDDPHVWGLGEDGDVATLEDTGVVLGGKKILRIRFVPGSEVGGRWEPMVDLTDPENPGFVHLGNGDILMLWVED